MALNRVDQNYGNSGGDGDDAVVGKAHCHFYCQLIGLGNYIGYPGRPGCNDLLTNIDNNWGSFATGIAIWTAPGPLLMPFLRGCLRTCVGIVNK